MPAECKGVIGAEAGCSKGEAQSPEGRAHCCPSASGSGAPPGSCLEVPPSQAVGGAGTCLEARECERFPKSTVAMSDGDINPPKLLLKMECLRPHNSSLIVKELIKPTASLLTEFYCVIFTTGQAESGISGLC